MDYVTPARHELHLRRARNIEDVYRKLLSLRLIHSQNLPETQTLQPPPPGGLSHSIEDQARAEESQRLNPNNGVTRSSVQIMVTPVAMNVDQATTPKSPPVNPCGAILRRTQMDPPEYGPGPVPRALTDIFDLSAQPY